MLENPPEKIDNLWTHMGNFKRGVKTILKNLVKLLEMKNTLSETQKLFAELINSRETNQWTWKLVKKKISEMKYKEKEYKKTGESIQDLWDNIKWSNIWVSGASEWEVKGIGEEEIFSRDNSREFNKIDERHWPTEARNSEKLKKYKRK